jgi:hypothetical protein
LGCGITGCFGEVTIHPQTVNVIVVFGALVGATAFLFARFLLWKYGMIFRTFCWAIGITPASGKAWALTSHAIIPNCLTNFSVHSAPVRGRSPRQRLLARRLS